MNNVHNQVFDRNYKLLTELCPKIKEIHIFEHLVLKSENHLPLHITFINQSTDFLKIAITHYKKQNDDLIPDPELIIKFHKTYKIVEVLSYQDEFGFVPVYNERGEIDIQRRDELNNFLRNWLRRLLQEEFHQ